MWRTLLLLCLVAPFAPAQQTQIGGTIGTGGFSSMHGSFTTAGVEVCVDCGGRFGFFMEYSRWWLTPPSGETSVLDLAAGGLRIQGRNKYVRPFFDIGVSAGLYDGHPHDFVHKSENFGTGGIALGFGASVSIGSKLYVRPQVRIAGGVPNGVVVASASVGVGYRF
jgi:hypothetical protein